MSDRLPYFQIDGQVFPIPTDFRLGDTVLIERVTGMKFLEWGERSDDTDDPVAVLGLLAAAVWQANPRWPRDKVVRYVEQIPIADIEAHDPAAEEDDESPPAETPEEVLSPSAPISENGSQTPSGSLEAQ